MSVRNVPAELPRGQGLTTHGHFGRQNRTNARSRKMGCQPTTCFGASAYPLKGVPGQFFGFCMALATPLQRSCQNNSDTLRQASRGPHGRIAARENPTAPISRAWLGDSMGCPQPGQMNLIRPTSFSFPASRHGDSRWLSINQTKPAQDTSAKNAGRAIGHVAPHRLFFSPGLISWSFLLASWLYFHPDYRDFPTPNPRRTSPGF